MFEAYWVDKPKKEKNYGRKILKSNKSNENVNWMKICKKSIDKIVSKEKNLMEIRFKKKKLNVLMLFVVLVRLTHTHIQDIWKVSWKEETLYKRRNTRIF